MKVINPKPLPHGIVPFHEIADMKTRDVVMKLNENVVTLAKQLAEVQMAVKEQQLRTAEGRK